MDDDPGEVLALPRTITAELEGPEIPPTGGAPPPPPSDGGVGGSPPPEDGGPPFDLEAARARARREVKNNLEILRTVAERLCATETDAEDLVQTTAERACKRGIPSVVISPRAWLITMMHRIFIDQCRATRRRPRHEPLDDKHVEALHNNVAQLPFDEPEPDWACVTIDDVHAALQEISEKFRKVYVLAAFENLPYSEIATRMKISSATVGSRLSRVRTRLRGILAGVVGRNDHD